jgi:stearoyl-CoA desaturase (delta-9 desaturase)
MVDVKSTRAKTDNAYSLPGLIGWVAVVLGLPLAAGLGVASMWRPPTLLEVLIGVSLYTVAGLGISLGWHRFFTHKSYQSSNWFSVILAVSGSLAFEGSLASWVANHKIHHRYTDLPGDPHSPWNKDGVIRGFFHAHIGWLSRPGVDEKTHAREILSNKHLAAISRWWWTLALLGIILPAALVGVFLDSAAFLGVLVWSGLVRVVLFHHVTWSVNSVCHMIGSRTYDTNDQSRNVWWLAIPSFGESWHNNHHHLPRSARHGSGPKEIDLTAELLRLLEKLGVVRNCVWADRQG